MYPWDSHRPSICPSVRPYHTDALHAFRRVRGKSRPGHTPFLFSHPPVLYFLLHAGIPTRTLYALLFKGVSQFLLVPLFPAPRSFVPLSLSSSSNTRGHVSLSINDFYGLPSFLGFLVFFFSRRGRTCLLLEEKKRNREQRFSIGRSASRSCTCRSRPGRG